MKWLSLLTTLFFVSSYAQSSMDGSSYKSGTVAGVKRLITLQFSVVDSILRRLSVSDDDDSTTSINSDPTTESDKIFNIIQANKDIIINDTSLSLKGLINIIASKDGQLFVLSWNTKLGGTLVDFASVVLYRSATNVFYKRLIDSSDSYVDNPKIYFDTIYSFKTNDSTLYVAQGVGQGSNLLPWQKLMAFKITANTLSQPTVFPKNKNDIFIEFDRSHLKDPYNIPKIKVSEAGKMIRLPVPSEEEGFNGKYSVLKFNGTRFVVSK